MQAQQSIRRGDPQWPILFDLWEKSPEILYYIGDIALLQTTCVAIIGTRTPSLEAKKTAYKLALALVQKKITILSGLALGCDTYAHRGAVDGDGSTIAVLGTPLCHIYPAKNVWLAEQIVQKGGLLISPYNEPAKDQREGKYRFIQRDHIQAALSMAVIPVQADCDDGTRHAVGWAQHQGRLIAVPRPIPEDYKQNPASYGLIQQLIESQNVMILESKQDYPAFLTALRP